MEHSQESQNPPHSPTEAVLDRALAVVEFLRTRCPWDARQTHHSLRRYLLDEAHEVIDAIDAGDDTQLADELGDLLLNVAFQIVIAEERGVFDRETVVGGLEAKMRRRHPHLYGGEAESWERIKARERGRDPDAVEERSLLQDLVSGTDGLSHANKLQARAAEVGFDWPDATGAWAKVREEVDEVEELDEAAAELEEEIGDLLFSVVNYARKTGIDPATAMGRANAKFARRFRAVEKRARAEGMRLEEAGLETLDRFWDEIKREDA